MSDLGGAGGVYAPATVCEGPPTALNVIFALPPRSPSEYAEPPPPMRGNLLCKREQSETQFQLCRVQPATDECQIAAVRVEIPLADFNAHDSTALP